MEKEERILISFWTWFFKGTGARPGYKRLLNKSIFIHFVIGITLAFLIEGPLFEIAQTTILPLSGVLIGLTFAWAGNAQSVLQTEEIQLLSEYKEGGFFEYAYTYQAAILAVLVTLISWGLAGLHLYDRFISFTTYPELYFLLKCVLFTLTSLAFRECWQAVSGAHALIRMRNEIRKAKKKQNESS